MRQLSVLLVLVTLWCYAASQGENQCCVDQPPPRVVVEKTGSQTRYRQATASSRYSTKCGTWGWRRCTRSQSYRFDIYQKKSYKQPCRKYQCCDGFVMLDNVCYANHELPTAVGHVADIKDGLSDIGNVDLKDIFGAVHDVIG